MTFTFTVAVEVSVMVPVGFFPFLNYMDRPCLFQIYELSQILKWEENILK